MDIEEIIGGFVVLIFIIIIGWAFFGVFVALPGGFGWAILFVILLVIIIAGVVIGILRGILG